MISGRVGIALLGCKEVGAGQSDGKSSIMDWKWTVDNQSDTVAVLS